MEYPLEFYDAEYCPRLGLYQKWIHGNPNQRIEKLYSMSAFQCCTSDNGFVLQQDYQKYAEYLALSVQAIIDNSPQWYIRLYIDESILNPDNPESVIWIQKLELLKLQDRVQIICIKFPRYYVNGSHQGLLAVMFRYLTLFDPNVIISLFRDIDNIWTQQHQYFIDEWIDRGDDICLYLNNNYKRQQACSLTQNDVILEDKFYKTILSGLWNIRNPDGAFPISIWQKIFAYIESYTDFVNNDEFIDYKFYQTRFVYGFDELALSRVVLPIFIQMGLSVYTIPIKIYDLDYFNNLFDTPVLHKFLGRVSDKQTLITIKKIMIDNYWSMFTENAGLSQYILGIITNIYFGIIMNKSKFYNNDYFINSLKNKIIPIPLLMSIGIFTFKNYVRYSWYPNDTGKISGSEIVDKFLNTNKRITLEEWTAGSDLSNNGNGTPPVVIPVIIPIVKPYLHPSYNI